MFAKKAARVWGTWVLLGLASGWTIHARPVVAPSAGSVETGRTCLFQATQPDGSPGVFEWAVEPGGGTIVGEPGGGATYTAPALGTTPAVFRITVTDSADRSRVSEVKVYVRPAIPGLPALIADVLMPAAMGADWILAAPEMVECLKRADIAGPGGPVPPKLCPIPGDSALTALRDHWLLSTGHGLSAVTAEGKASALPDPRRASASAPRTGIEASGGGRQGWV